MSPTRRESAYAQLRGSSQRRDARHRREACRLQERRNLRAGEGCFTGAMPRGLTTIEDARLLTEKALAKLRILQSAQLEGTLLDREEVEAQWAAGLRRAAGPRVGDGRPHRQPRGSPQRRRAARDRGCRGPRSARRGEPWRILSASPIRCSELPVQPRRRLISESRPDPKRQPGCEARQAIRGIRRVGRSGARQRRLESARAESRAATGLCACSSHPLRVRRATLRQLGGARRTFSPPPAGGIQGRWSTSAQGTPRSKAEPRPTALAPLV
jgi:hypothetical protein